VKRLLALVIAALAVAPATASADPGAPVMSVSVDVEVGSSVAAVDETPACVPQLSMRLAQRPVARRRGLPVLATGRSYRFAGRLTCAPAGAIVDAGEAGTFAVGPDGRIAARVVYRGARTFEFRALDAAVRIAVRPR
jgi:hypothetical protein